jgi:hypothetical protein
MKKRLLTLKFKIKLKTNTMSYSKYQSNKNPIKHAAKLYGLSNPSESLTDVIKTKVEGGTQIKTITKKLPKNYTVAQDQPQASNPNKYIQDLINKGITREEVQGRQLVDPSNYNLFPKSKPEEKIEFIPDPVVEKEPEVDYSYLDGLTPTHGYKGKDGMQYGTTISSTVGSTLRGGKDPMTRPMTQLEADYLNKKMGSNLYGGTMDDYYKKNPNTKRADETMEEFKARYAKLNP